MILRGNTELNMEDQSEPNNPVSDIKKLFQMDQADREEYARDASKGLAIRQRDEQRLKRAKEILAGNKIIDPHDLNMLAFIFLHGDKVEDYEKALELTTQAVEAGLPPDYSLIPQTTDRLMIQSQLDRGVPLEQLTQRYGTQTRSDPNGNLFKPKLDGTVTKEEFEKFGIEQLLGQ